MIDEQSVIFTMAYAKNAGIWPRKKLDESGELGFGGGEPSRPGETAAGGPGTGAVAEPGKGHPMQVAPESFAAEGILKDALVRSWEQVRAKKVESIEGFVHTHVRGRGRLPAPRCLWAPSRGRKRS